MAVMFSVFGIFVRKAKERKNSCSGGHTCWHLLLRQFLELGISLPSDSW